MASFQLQNSVMLSRLKPFGISFEKSLSDLIKGIRSHSKESPESLGAFLEAAVLECKDELSTTDLETKATAVLKLAYLEMFGYDMSWCNFQILEIMSSSNFQQKRIGYLAAVQSFKSEQDLLILATNQFKKDLNSHNHIEVGLALSGIATIVTPNLSKDIHDDVLLKLNHSSPYIRKKAILAMYKIFLQYPDSLRQDFTRVIEKLDDEDVSVVSATINVICEISKKNPRIFMNYLPKFFSILEETENNWMIIRILKLLNSLSKVEPRLKKKIVPILMNMLSTDAVSLKYECINCIVSGSMLSPDSKEDKSVAHHCLDIIKLHFFRGDTNVHFMGLLALINILKLFPSLMHEAKDIDNIVKDCLQDSDIIIKQKALEVCQYLVNESNMVEIVKVLLLQIIPSEETIVSESLKLDVTNKILEVVSQDNYAHVPNFDWYIAVLKDITNLTLLPLSPTANTVISSKTSNLIASRIGKEYKTLASKIPSIRPSIMVKAISESVSDVKILQNCPSLLRDFYFILGEYIDDLSPLDDDDDDSESEEEDNKNYEENTPVYFLGKKIQLLNAFINNQVDKSLNLTTSAHFPISQSLVTLPLAEVLIVLIQALVKLYNSIVADYIRFYSVDNKLSQSKLNELKFYLFKLITFLSSWENHENYEVQERTLSWLEFLKLVLEALTHGEMSDVQRLQKEEVDYYEKLSRERLLQREPKEESDNDDDESDDNGNSDSDNSDSDESDENLASTAPDNDYEEFESSSSESEEEDEEEEEEPADNLIDISVEGPIEENVEEHVDSDVLESLPVLLTHILPSFFKTYELNPIAEDAQRNIPIPFDLDLDTEINESLEYKPLSDSDDESQDESLLFSGGESENSPDNSILSPHSVSEEISRKKERLERLKDDPYYITSGNYTGKKTKKIKNLLDDVSNYKDDNSESNSINLLNEETAPKTKTSKAKVKSKKTKKDKIVILSEEVVENPVAATVEVKTTKPKKKNILKIDSSNLDNFDLNSSSISDNVSTLDNPAEYNIDLEALRKKLSDDTAKAEEVVVKKKKKASKAEGTKKKKKKATEDKPEADKEVAPVKEDSPQDNAHKVITVVPKKKAKKKAKIVE